MKPLDSDLWERIRQSYLGGLSIRQVSAEVGVSESWAGIVIKRLGISRGKSAAAILRQPPVSKHWRSSRQAARKKMESFLGRKLERYEHVHHIDHNYTNNAIENLCVLNASEHAYHHHPKNPIPRWLRPERKAYMKKYFKEYRRAPKA